MPRLRYQIPSPVCQASSASILLPSVSRIVTGPTLVFPSAAVEIGLELNSIRSGLKFVEGVGVALGEGDGSTDGLALATDERCEGKSGPGGWTMLELNEDWLELSVVGWRVIA